MTRFVRALIRLRWRTLVNAVGRSRSDEMDRLARIGGLLIRLFLVLAFVPAAIALAAATFVGARAMASDEPFGEFLGITARLVLFVVTLAVLLGPVLRTMGGLEPELRRLLLMPIPRRTLHLADSVGSVLDPWIMPPLLALAALPLGLASTGAMRAAAIAAAAAATFVVALAALGSAAGSATVILFRDRRRAELVSVGLVLTLTVASFVPGILDDGASAEGRARRALAVERLKHAVTWLAPLPSEQFTTTLDAAVHGRTAEALGRVGLSGVTALLLFVGSAVLHGRVLDNVESGSGGRRVIRRGRAGARLPGVSPVLSELALCVVRSSIRTVRGRIAVFFTAIIVGLLSLAAHSLSLEMPARWLAVQGPLLVTGGALFAALSLQPVMLNQFAIDGSGLTLSVLMPITARQLVHGKLLGHLLLAAFALGLCTIVAAAVVRAGDPWLWLAATLAAVAGFVGLVPTGALLSIALPKAADLSRIGRAGNPHQLAGFLGAIVGALLFGASSTLWIVPGVLFGRPLLACASALLGLVLAVVAAALCSSLAANLFERRLENLCLVASGR